MTRDRLSPLLAACLAQGKRAAVLRDALRQARGRLLPLVPVVPVSGNLLRAIDAALAENSGDVESDVGVMECALIVVGSALKSHGKPQHCDDVMAALELAQTYALAVEAIAADEATP